MTPWDRILEAHLERLRSDPAVADRFTTFGYAPSRDVLQSGSLSAWSCLVVPDALDIRAKAGDVDGHLVYVITAVLTPAGDSLSSTPPPWVGAVWDVYQALSTDNGRLVDPAGDALTLALTDFQRLSQPTLLGGSGLQLSETVAVYDTEIQRSTGAVLPSHYV
ncbi:MAG: hypothetical protein AAGC60_00315 [Acidobacteriota bacterium]